jgi:hypothetical protein
MSEMESKANPDPVRVLESNRKLAGPSALKKCELFYDFFGIDISNSPKRSRPSSGYKVHPKPFQNKNTLDLICPKKLLGFEEIEEIKEAETYLRNESIDVITVGSPTSNGFGRAIFGYQEYDAGTLEHEQFGYVRKTGNIYPGSLEWGVDSVDFELLASTPCCQQFKRGSDVKPQHQWGKNWFLKVEPEHLVEDAGLFIDKHAGALLVPVVNPEQQDQFLTDYLAIVSMPNFLSNNGRLFALAGTHRPGTKAAEVIFEDFESYRQCIEKQRKRVTGKNTLTDQMGEEVVFAVSAATVPPARNLRLVYYKAIEF